MAEEDAIRIVSKVAPGPYNQLSKTEITNLLLSLARQGIDDRHPITYVSVPVTTGPAYLDWLIRHLDDSHRSTDQVWAVKQEVSETNRRRARDVIKRLRTRLPGMVIDPSSLIDIDDWRQSDYHSFWLKVIAQYADRLILVDGWQYSVGCTIEFAESVKLGLPTFTENCERLEVGSGIRLVRGALQEYAAARVDPVPLRHALEAAEKAAAA